LGAKVEGGLAFSVKPDAIRHAAVVRTASTGLGLGFGVVVFFASGCRVSAVTTRTPAISPFARRDLILARIPPGPSRRNLDEEIDELLQLAGNRSAHSRHRWLAYHEPAAIPEVIRSV
jgi:hypothetical protein